MLSYMYLASPYSDPDSSVRKKRFIEVSQVAGKLFKKGHCLFVPIAMSHPITKYTPLMPTKWKFWEKFDREFVIGAKELWVVTLEGWKESVGVQAEIGIARKFTIPIKLINPKTLEATVYEG